MDFEDLGDFYKSSQRNVAVLLIFWISYIVAYFVCACLLTSVGRKSTTLYVRKRVSNLSRLMLLSNGGGRGSGSGRRAKSLPPPRSNSQKSPSDDTNGPYDLSDSEGRVHSDVEYRASNDGTSGGKFFNGHILSSFVPEYTVAVLCTSSVMQGILLIPLSMTMLSLLDERETKMSCYWSWLSLEMMRKWWKWLWNSGLTLLLVGIPFSLILIESRGHRDAPLMKRVWHIVGRLSGKLAGIGTLRFIIALSATALMYVISVYVGWLSSFRLSEWIQIINVGVISLTLLLSVVCVPLGFISCLAKISLATTTFANHALIQTELKAQKNQVDDQITALERTIKLSQSTKEIGEASTAIAAMQQDSTPISSKSIRSKLLGLKKTSGDLQRMLISSTCTLMDRLLKRLLFIFLHALLYYFVYVQLFAFLKFIAAELLWHVPGVQAIDWILFKLASTVSLVEGGSQGQVEFKGSTISGLTLISSSFGFCFLFAMGLYRLSFKRQRRVVVLNLPFNEYLFERTRLEKYLPICGIMLLTFTLGGMAVCLSGSIDEFNNQNLKGLLITSYTSKLLALLPSFHIDLLLLLHRVTFLRFPLLLWLVFAYRLFLVGGLTLMAIVSLRATLTSIRIYFAKGGGDQRSSLTTAVHSHID